MYNVVLIDDQIRFLKQLEKIIPWNELGFNLVEKFRSAEKALEYIEKNSVDLVITDIKMSDMSGLDISKVLSKNFPDIKIIILSAYDRFDYAKEALRYNVFDFIVKPCSKEKIIEVLTSVHEQLNSIDKTLFSDAYYFKRNNIFASIYYRNYDEQTLKKELSEMNININLDDFTYKIITLDETDINMFLETHKLPSERLIFLLSKLIPQETHYAYASIINDKNNTFKILLLSKPGIQSTEFAYYSEKYISILKSIFISTLKSEIKLEFYNPAKVQNIDARKSTQQIEIVNDVINYVKENFKNDISLDKIAAHKHISISHLCNIFKSHTNYTVSEYINIVRIEEAQKLIKEEKIKINAVAFCVGFNSTSYFHRIFKQITGYTPNEYREICKNIEKSKNG